MTAHPLNRCDLIGRELDRLCPLLPPKDRQAILEHALYKKSLKKARADKAAWLSLTAYIRHNMTQYNDMLDEGYDVEEARFFCLNDMQDVLKSWGCRRKIEASDISKDDSPLA